MLRRDTRKEYVLFHLSSELLYHAHHQSEEFQQTLAELRQHLERSNAEIEQRRNLC